MKISDRSRFATARMKRGFSPVAAGVAAVFVVLCAPAAFAAEDDLYTVEQVQVDATSETAAKAREVALAQGYSIAFQRLIDRFVPRDKQAQVPLVEGESLTGLVRDFEVDSEKTSRVRYLAKLRIRFNRVQVRQLLRDAEVPYAETRSKPLLVLPVLRRAGAVLLWDNPNPWREAWAALPAADGLLPLFAPKGGLRDMSFISAEQAARGDLERLDAIARRYDTFGVVVATAAVKFDVASGVPGIEVSVRRTTDPKKRVWRNTIASQADETPTELLTRAARETLDFVQEQWKLDNLLRFDEKNELLVDIPLGDLGEWVRMRRRLAEIAYISKSELVALSRRTARVRLHYLGGQEQLRTALTQSDLNLTEGTDDDWILRYVPKDKSRRRTRADTR